jgi:chitodextrinase
MADTPEALSPDLTPEEQEGADIMARAYALREFILTHTATLSDDDIADAPIDAVAQWTPGADYVTGDRMAYDGRVYRVLQGHTSQADWTPDIVPALYAPLRTQSERVADAHDIAEWEQPTAETPYAKGDRVAHNGAFWESLIDSNVWEPTSQTEALSLWKRINLD